MEKKGRAGSQRPPSAAAARISMTNGTSSARCTSPWMCLPVCVRQATSSSSTCVLGGASAALTMFQTTPTSSAASATSDGVGEVLHRRRAPLAAAVVERVGAGAVEREVHVGAVAAHVRGGVAPGEQHVARRRGQRLLDQPRRDAHAAGVRVHGRTGLGQQRLRLGGRGT